MLIFIAMEMETQRHEKIFPRLYKPVIEVSETHDCQATPHALRTLPYYILRYSSAGKKKFLLVCKGGIIYQFQLSVIY